MGVFAVSNSWLYAVTPRLNMFVSKRDWAGLDALFLKNLLLSGATFLAGAITVLALMYFLKGRYAIIDRFSDPLSMLFLAVVWFLADHRQRPRHVPSRPQAGAARASVGTLRGLRDGGDDPLCQVLSSPIFLPRLALRLRLGCPVDSLDIQSEEAGLADDMTSAAYPYVLTVAVPTYNRASYLDICLHKSAGQIKAREREVELLVSDNCSY